MRRPSSASRRGSKTLWKVFPSAPHWPLWGTRPSDASHPFRGAGGPGLTKALFEIMALENRVLEARGAQAWSAELSLGVVRALTRWRQTYLMLDLAEYGEAQPAALDST